MMIRITLLATIFFAIACNENGSKQAELKAQADSLFKIVMRGHDAGMANMSKLSRKITQVQHELDSLAQLSSSKIDTVYRGRLLTLKEDLGYAEMGMNKWMEDFEVYKYKDSFDLRVKYLESERDKVAIIRDSILNSLRRADSLIKK
jgi:hypothetical protein